MIVLTASGTGGHVYPAIAVAQYLKEKEFSFLIEQGRVSQSILDRHQYDYEAFPIFRKKLWSYFVGFFKAFFYFRNHNVQYVYSFGGYVTIPIVLAACFCRIPVMLFEQNTIPGRANRLLSRCVSKICLSFQESEKYFNKKAIVGGNPIRSVYLSDSVVDSLLSLSWKLGKRCLVFGGSQGASSLNSFIESHYEWFESQGVSLIHIMGEASYRDVYADQPQIICDSASGVKRVIVPYIDDMKRLYEWADYVVSRAGATSVSELMVYRKPALLIPYPHAVDNHQYYNACAFVDLGFGIMALQDEVSKSVLKNLFQFELNIDSEDVARFHGWKDLVS
ncbi:MAG: hypothetical protein CL503_05235 [Actinobacteria bacterium]|nr:hypothetical protein [Actinomycetota bacterium]|tara:strand:+ start:6525 stop:7529 length:1005 start_codon:yes stop_codon:yes gene_type:complete